jgi:hypothetical protein
LYGQVPSTLDTKIRSGLCGEIVSPMDTFRQWLYGNVPLKNENEENPPGKRDELPCSETKAVAEKVLAPSFSLVLSGDTHTFQMFKPDADQPEAIPVQLVIGNGGDALEDNTKYPGAEKALQQTDAALFGIKGHLWMRNSFGFAMLEKLNDAPGWTATLYDPDGKVLLRCTPTRTGECSEH